MWMMVVVGKCVWWIYTRDIIIVVCICIWKLIALDNELRLNLIHLCQTVYVDYDWCEAYP